MVEGVIEEARFDSRRRSGICCYEWSTPVELNIQKQIIWVKSVITGYYLIFFTTIITIHVRDKGDGFSTFHQVDGHQESASSRS